MRIQQSSSRFEIDSRFVHFVRMPNASECLVEHRKHGVNRGQDVRFRAPEGRETASREAHLQGSKVAAPQRYVVQEVHRALALTRVDLLEHVERLPLQVNEISTDLQALLDQRSELAIRCWLARVPRGQRFHHTYCLSQRYDPPCDVSKVGSRRGSRSGAES